MNWFESIIYGFVSGLAEFLPLSSYAHQQIYLQICGQSFRDPVRDLFVHIAMLLAIRISCRSILANIRRSRGVSIRNNGAGSKAQSDQRFVKRATIPMIVVFFIFSYIIRFRSNLLLIAFVLMLNGIILFVPERLIKSNKDSSAMSHLDSVLVGIFGGLAAVPGLSRIGCCLSAASLRGADKQHALRWGLLLSMPAILALIVVDIILLLSGIGVSGWKQLFHYLLSAISTFGACYAGIRFIHFLSLKQNFSIFSYYSWGVSLVAFFLYLTVV